MEIEICGKFKVQIDAEDFDKICCFKWRIADCSRHNTVKLYARAMVWNKGKSRTYYMHRVLMGEPPGMVVDHIDNDGLNNKKNNLQIMTVKENARKQKQHSDFLKKQRGENGRYIKPGEVTDGESKAAAPPTH